MVVEIQQLSSDWQQVTRHQLLIWEQSTRAGLSPPSLLGLQGWSFWGSSPSALHLPVPQPFVDLYPSRSHEMTHQAGAPPSSKEYVLTSLHPRVPLPGSHQPRRHHILHNFSQPRPPMYATLVSPSRLHIPANPEASGMTFCS